jgi:hypothetical protein
VEGAQGKPESGYGDCGFYCPLWKKGVGKLKDVYTAAEVAEIEQRSFEEGIKAGQVMERERILDYLDAFRAKVVFRHDGGGVSP